MEPKLQELCGEGRANATKYTMHWCEKGRYGRGTVSEYQLSHLIIYKMMLTAHAYWS